MKGPLTSLSVQISEHLLGRPKAMQGERVNVGERKDNPGGLKERAPQGLDDETAA